MSYINEMPKRFNRAESYTKEEQYQIVKTMLLQLGGNKFMQMTGTTQPVNMNGRLKLKLRRNKTGANYLIITWNAGDLYDMDFISVRGGSVRLKASFEDLYCDMIEQQFEDATGLYTRLF